MKNSELATRAYQWACGGGGMGWGVGGQGGGSERASAAGVRARTAGRGGRQGERACQGHRPGQPA